MRKVEKIISLVVTILMVFTIIQIDTYASNEFEFDTATKTVVKYNGASTDVIVPSTLSGSTVENIGAGAFQGNTSLVSVQLPASLKTIGNSAFEGCTNLKTVEFSDVIENLDSIGDKAFSKCNQLTVNWVIRNNHNINVAAGALQSNGHSFLMLSQMSGETVTKINNLDGTYYQGIEEKTIMGAEWHGVSDQEFMQGYIDMSDICNLYDWKIDGTVSDDPWGNYDDSLYRQFNVPTDNSQIDYRIINDPMMPHLDPPILGYIQNNRFYINGQKPMLYGYASYPGSDREIEFVIIPNKPKVGSFKVETPPLKTTYYEGETFDPTGIIVSLVDRYNDTLYLPLDYYSNLFRFNGESYEFGEPVILSSTDTSITVELECTVYNYGILDTGTEMSEMYFKTTLPITVKRIYATEINTVTPPKKLNYFEGDKFDPTGLVIHVKNNNGSEEDVTYNDDTKDKFSFSLDVLKSTDKEIEIIYDGQTIDYDINVTPLKITDISIKEKPQIEYYAGDYFNPAGLTLVTHYNNGTTQDIVYSESTKNDFKFSLDQLKATDKEIKITYQGFEKTLGLTVHPFFIERLELKQAPKNLEYYTKDNFDPSGLIITAYFNNGTDKEIVYDDDTKSQFQFSVNQLKETDKEVKITYQGLELTQQLTVHPLFIESMEIKSLPTKLEYYEEDIFDPSGLILEVRYNSGKEDTIEYNNQTKDDFSFSLKELSLGDEEIEITYQTKTMKQAISVKERYTKERVEKEEVKIEGQFEENAYLSIEENQRNEEGQGILKDKLILRSYEVSVVGKYRGELRITFEVGNENNGKKAHILHQKSDGSIETFEEEIKEGKVTVTVHELSPFIIYIDKENENTGHEDIIVPPADQTVPPSINVDNEELNENQELTNIKQPIMNNENNIPTGDNETIILYITIGGIGLAGIGYYLFKRKQKE